MLSLGRITVYSAGEERWIPHRTVLLHFANSLAMIVCFKKLLVRLVKHAGETCE